MVENNKSVETGEKEIIGKVYDIQGFSVHDGPGIRTTVYLKGCPLSCLWCHSPESQKFHNQLSWISMRCPGVEECGKCISRCPKNAISVAEPTESFKEEGKMIQLVHVDRSICDNCGECTKICYNEALYICGKDYTVEEIVKRVARDKPFYDKSGGGVTMSGGEALCQPHFVRDVFKALKEKDIHTALDTTGYAEWSTVEEVLPYTDLFLYDLKHMDSHSHEMATGVPNEKILANAKLIAEHGGKLQIRIPLIPLYNDDDENLTKCAEFIKSLGDAVTIVQLLPYHNLGVMKYARLDETKKVFEAVPHKQEKIDHMEALMKSFDLPVMVH